MEIRHSKNINTGNLHTHGGNVHLGDNYYKSIEYKEWVKKIGRLKKLSTLVDTEEEKLEYLTELREEEKKLEEFKQGVISLAETFQKIEIDTGRLQSARDFFDEGKFKEARAILGTEEIGSDQEKLLQHKAALAEKSQQNENDLRNNADEYLVLAKLTAINFDLENRFEKAVAYFESSLKSDRNGENVFSYAYFLREHNQNNKATPLYQEALQIDRKLAEENPQRYLPDLATTLNNLANLQKAKNEFEEAEKSYEEALSIYRKLAEVNRQAYLPDVGVILNNLGILQMAKKEFKEADRSYQEALEIRRELAEINPQTYLPSVAITLNNLAILQNAKKESEEAEESYQEALGIRKELAKVNPQIYLPHVAATLNNLAVLQRDKNDFVDAKKSCQEALEIRRKLAKDNPQTYLPNVATTLNNLAALHMTNNDIEEAEKSYEEALEIYQKLAKINPETYLPSLILIQINMGHLYQESKINKELSIQFLDEAITNLIPFRHIPYIQNYLEGAFRVLHKWGINGEEYMNEKMAGDK